MKKALYILLLVAETALVVLMAMGTWAFRVWIVADILGILSLTLWAVLMVRQIRRLKKTGDAELKRKIFRRIPLIMLIPPAALVLSVIAFIVGMAMVT